MTTRRVLLILGAVIVLAGWYAFRPERLILNQRVSEGFPASESSKPSVILSGAFHGVSHQTKGVATIYQTPDGKRTLRFTDFETSNGPDVQVYLVANTDANDDNTVTKSGFVPLGALKGNIGNQNYEISSDVDLTKYRAITIWCRRFGVNFATAPLSNKV
jgi:hypothetical protein